MQITAKTKRLTLEKKVRKNLEDFEAKIQITAQLTRLKVLKKMRRNLQIFVAKKQ